MVLIKCDFCGREVSVNEEYSTFCGIKEDGWVEFKRKGQSKIEHCCPDCLSRIKAL